jgi:hypothetical protein
MLLGLRKQGSENLVLPLHPTVLVLLLLPLPLPGLLLVLLLLPLPLTLPELRQPHCRRLHSLGAPI